MSFNRSFKLFVVFVLLAIGILPRVTFGQAPSGPTDPFHSEFAVANPPSQFDEILLVTEIPAGTTTAPASFGGDQYVTVTQGQLTRRVTTNPKSETAYQEGNTYVQQAGEMYELVNTGSSPARLISTVLLPKGTPLTANQEMPKGANVLYRAQREFLTPPTTFKVVQDVLEFAPGAAVPPHHHGGDVLGVVIQGQMTNHNGSSVTEINTGDGFVENLGQVHSIGNESSSPAAFFGTILLPPGAEIITIQGAPTRTLPTSGASFDSSILLWLGLVGGLVLVVGVLLARERKAKD